MSIKSIGNELKLNIINEMVNDLITALNITESEFVISTSKQLDEILFVFPLGVLQVESQKQL